MTRSSGSASGRVDLFRIMLGDRARRAPGLFVSVDAALRGLLTAGPDGEVIHAFACDRRIEPPGGMMIFRDLSDALSWLAPRLDARPSDGSLPSLGRDWRRRTAPGLNAPSAAEAEAREDFIACAEAYCFAMRDDAPAAGPLRDLIDAWNSWRRHVAAKRERRR